MKKFTIAILFFALALTCAACATNQAQEPTTPAPVTTTALPPGVYDINQSIDEEYLQSMGARVLSKELMTYRDCLEQFPALGEDHEIDGGQRVWVVQSYYPTFDTIRGGVFANATTISLYNAETGFYYGYSVSGDEVSD